MRVAFFGGTFDPIHRGHLRLACAAADAFALDRVLFAPVGNQPLKPEATVASYADRIEMARLACNPEPPQPATGNSADPRFAVSTLDAPRCDGSPNYTVDSLAALARELPGASLFVLTGADSFLDLRRWRSPGRLLELAEWIVVSRPEFPLSEARLAPLALTQAQRARVHLLATVHEDVSATSLRRSLQAGDPCPGLLPLAVAAYIQSHGLYR
ncbi:MAG: nicotinate (nicotinamide) nucleotide adenylyltransferase [Acidobacteriaceae bacterium]|jgi:nicotinate-nucleotide adenylyltransferase